MSQMRKDVFTGRWVIVAENMTVKPSDFHFKRFVREATFCPFCETHEASTPPEVFAIRTPGSSPTGRVGPSALYPTPLHGCGSKVTWDVAPKGPTI